MGDASQASVSAPTLQNVRQAVAVRMTFRDRVCFASVKTLSLDVGCSERTIQRSLRQLVQDGTLECLGYLLPSGRKVRSLVYRFKAGVSRLVTQRLHRRAKPPTSPRSLCFRRNLYVGRRHERSAVSLFPYEPKPISTQELLGGFIDVARGRGAIVPARVIGQLARNIKQLLDEGIPAEAIEAGLERLLQRRVVKPELLPHFVMEASLPVQADPKLLRYGRGMTTRQILDATRGLP